MTDRRSVARTYCGLCGRELKDHPKELCHHTIVFGPADILEAYERGRDDAAQAWEDSLLDME